MHKILDAITYVTVCTSITGIIPSVPVILDDDQTTANLFVVPRTICMLILSFIANNIVIVEGNVMGGKYRSIFRSNVRSRFKTGR